MKRILAFCFFPAFTPPSNGGEARLFYFYLALSRHFEVTLITSSHPGGVEERIHHGLNFVERRIPKDAHFASAWQELQQYASGGDLSGPCVAASARFATPLHHAYLEEYGQADVIMHDFPFTVGYDLFIGTDRKPRIYNAHNCETQLYRELHPGAASGPIHEIARECERKLLAHCDLLLHCSEQDLAALNSLAGTPGFQAVYVPHGMTPGAAHTNQRRGQRGSRRGEFDAVFMGSAHPPNVLAARFIVETLAPALPDVHFHLIGSCLPEGNHPRNVIRHGVVSEQEKQRLLRECDLALNPMDSGSGSNVKVLDYLSSGLPVLSTTFGMRGIDARPGEHYIDASLQEFTARLRRLVESRELLARVGDAGRTLAFERYTWTQIASSAAECLLRLAAGARRDFEPFVLALNDYEPFATVGGGGTRMRGLYAGVARWRPVILLAFSADDRISIRSPAPRVTVITVPRSPDHLREVASVNALFHVSADDIVAGKHCVANPLLAGLYQVLRQSAEAVVLEHCYMAALPHAFGDAFVYASHNNETALKNRLLEGHPAKAELCAVVEELETFAVEDASVVLAVCEDDAASLAIGKKTAGPILVVRNGVESPMEMASLPAQARDLGRPIAERSAVFLGSAHMPNVEAAQLIATKIAPAVPEVEFHLVGSVCDSVTDAPANVVRWGMVDDARKAVILQSCAVALNPMLAGSGSNVKLADYLANGLPVVTTEFGQRGYPAAIQQHLHVGRVAEFPDLVRRHARPGPASARLERKRSFAAHLSLDVIARRFVDTLKALPLKRRRVLCVTYRYLSPSPGGAEVHFERFVRALGESGMFDVDVVAPEVSGMRNQMRFTEEYSFDPRSSAPVDIPNVRFARFPVDSPEPRWLRQQLLRAWRAQVAFEQAISERSPADYAESGCTWGWDFPQHATSGPTRWSFSECEIFLRHEGEVRIAAYSDQPIAVSAMDQDGRMLGFWKLEGAFSLEFAAPRGCVRFRTSAPERPEDARPLGFLVESIRVGGRSIELGEPTLVQKRLSALASQELFQILDGAAHASRFAQEVELTPMRGPWSAGLEKFIAEQVAGYDLVVTHNNVFRPAVAALEEARKHGVPSILIPHAHLDDDFYHFPDLLRSAREATLVLAAPKLACEFLSERGCTTEYLPAGCDADEQFTEEDVAAFRAVHDARREFVLVLGRKASAKGYRKIIDAVEELNRSGAQLDVVLIGPDDDHEPIGSPCAAYLGRQPRSVVRGALRSCLMLCNMSVSESFGIVLLEAWLAGKPVIANRNCAAFHDLAVQEGNALLVSDADLPGAISRLQRSPELRKQLADTGRSTAKRFGWDAVAARFIGICDALSDRKQGPTH